MRPVERPSPLAVPTQRTDTSPCQPQLAHGILGHQTHDLPGHRPVVPHKVPTLDSEASQSLDLNMLPWLFHLATAAQVWLLLPGAGPAGSWGKPAATPHSRLVDLLSPSPAVPVPAKDPRAKKSMGQPYPAAPSRQSLSLHCSVNTCQVELFEFGGSFF